MMRRVMSVDIKKLPHREPRTPRKIRVNHPEPSPEAVRNNTRQQANNTTNHTGTSTGSPEATRSTGFAVPNRDLASAKEASRRMEILSNAISPRKLPEDRFNSIVKRLNYAATSSTSSTHSTTQDDQSVAGASDVSKPLPKKHPRKLSADHNSAAERTNGVSNNGGDT